MSLNNKKVEFDITFIMKLLSMPPSHINIDLTTEYYFRTYRPC